MTKLEPTILTRAADELLLKTDNPLHRQILENYRRHAILEVTGNWEEIFAPDMTVEHPVYYMNMRGKSFTLDGFDEVSAFYDGLADTDRTVMILEDEQLAVADWGFASEAVFNIYISGSTAAAQFARGEGGFDADPEKFYISRERHCMHWPYDERGRMIGEHVYVHDAATNVIEIPEAEFVTLEEARAKLLPLLRPLPKLPTL
ncbi:hypothetical protein [Rhodococcus opacus]|uniref:SnoaL-like domain-containing protein n=1 Tax=Rhodococcus opacus TaxID=37919 RepID=A0A2S8IBQ3_RHOOP|nr:hypothetical protein [Rhodococcus opacus]PQP12168.1 hypothetical protein C5613_42940 [Rhodococcus opacus]